MIRWLAFGAGKAQLQLAIRVCQEAVLPISSSALALAELRELFLRACDEGQCTTELQAEFETASSRVEEALEQALEGLFAEMDANSDGTVTLEEALAAFEATAADSSARGTKGTPTLAAVATLLEASRAAQRTLDEVKRLDFAARFATEGALAAIDEDGDGRISLSEAVQAPQRVVSWLAVWQDLVRRGKL